MQNATVAEIPRIDSSRVRVVTNNIGERILLVDGKMVGLPESGVGSKRRMIARERSARARLARIATV